MLLRSAWIIQKVSADNHCLLKVINKKIKIKHEARFHMDLQFPTQSEIQSHGQYTSRFKSLKIFYTKWLFGKYNEFEVWRSVFINKEPRIFEKIRIH